MGTRSGFRFPFFTIGWAAICLLAACGHNGAAPQIPLPGQMNDIVPAVSSATVQFKAIIPSSGIYMSTRSASVVVTASGVASSPVVINCTTLCTASITAPVGLDQFAVTLHNQTNGLGTQIASGSTSVQVVANVSNVVDVTFGSIVNSVALSVLPVSIPAGTPTSATLMAIAKDSTGNTIIGPGPYTNTSGSSLIITISKLDVNWNGKGRTTLSATSLGHPDDKIQVSYNGQAMYDTVFKATTSPAITGTVTGTTLRIIPTVIHEYPIPVSANPSPELGPITSGPDGNVWFGDVWCDTTVDGPCARPSIGRITPSGAITEYRDTTEYGYPVSLAVGADGAIWFIGDYSFGTDLSALVVASISSSGIYGAHFTPQGSASVCCVANGGAAGPDGNIWWTAIWQTRYVALVGKTSPTDSGIGYPVPSLPTSAFPNFEPMMIAAGPDGNLWFTAQGLDLNGTYDGQDFVVKITTSGVMTQFPIPTAHARALTIVKGPDGNLWFCESNANKIGKITTSGVITEYTLPHSGSGPNGLTVGPDNELWFTEYNRKMIGRLTTTGSESEYPVPSGASPDNIAPGADGTLYFVETGGKIGVLMY